MSMKTVVVCDECGRIKGEADQWIMFRATPKSIMGVPLTIATLSDWNEKISYARPSLRSPDWSRKWHG